MGSMNWTFDGNEWFNILAALIFFSLFWSIRKYFPPALVLMIWLFTNVFVASIDYFLLSTPFQLYYFGDNRSYEPISSLFHVIIFPSGSILFLYGYDKWKLYGKKAVGYVLVWTAFSVFFEWLCVITKSLTYTGWKLVYSIPTYPVAAGLCLLLFHFTKRNLEELYSTRPVEEGRVG